MPQLLTLKQFITRGKAIALYRLIIRASWRLPHADRSFVQHWARQPKYIKLGMISKRIDMKKATNAFSV
jgi:hypothetical protein